jgi:hypothetical protein
MAADPAALQLRLLQTVVEVAAEKNSTLVMPVPVELLRFFDRAARGTGQPGEPSLPERGTQLSGHLLGLRGRHLESGPLVVPGHATHASRN